MEVYPKLSEVKAIAASGKYRVCPVKTEILADRCTPIEALKILKNVSAHCYVLESVVHRENWGQYTFLGFDPKLAITCKDGRMQVGDVSLTTDDPSAVLRDVLSKYKSPKLEAFPPFTGGLVGYFAFESFGYAEPTIRTAQDDPEHFNDIDVMLFDKVIAFDHIAQKIILIANADLKDPETGYRKAEMDVKNLAELIKHGVKKEEPAGRLAGELTPMFDKDKYCAMVEKTKAYIREGDIFQAVIGNGLTAPYEGSLLNTYRVLRTTNPSPYMFYFSGTDVEIAGASPETLVKLKDGVLHTFPLAGTRPRGATDEEDQALEADLRQDEKELAEHDMLVDLGRNDLGRISQFGTVQVEKLHVIERYSHVMHIGSTVRGRIQDGKDALDAISAALPAGTLSGAPKIRACQIIGELEGQKRGIYGGAIGYIDFTGNMDVGIAIRLAYKRGGKVFVRSGAGIVADSVPEKEYQECLNKAKAVVEALKLAEEVNP